MRLSHHGRAPVVDVVGEVLLQGLVGKVFEQPGAAALHLVAGHLEVVFWRGQSKVSFPGPGTRDLFFRLTDGVHCQRGGAVSVGPGGGDGRGRIRRRRSPLRRAQVDGQRGGHGGHGGGGGRIGRFDCATRREGILRVNSVVLGELSRQI